MESEPQPGCVEARRYLLGGMSGVELSAIEKALLDSPEFYELVLAVEGELIDELLSGALRDPERARFLDYLSRLPDSAQRIELARCLLESADTKQRTAARKWPLMVTAAAAVLVTIAGAWAGWSFLPFGRGGENVSPPLEPRAVPVQALSPGMLRSTDWSGAASFTLSRETPLVELRLDLGADDYPSYRATLLDDEAKEILSSSGLFARATAERVYVPLSLPTERLVHGDYVILLEGVREPAAPETVARYTFRVRKD